jgi:hypothetical protein
MRADLDTNYHVQVNAGPCINGEISGCTNLVGMPSNAFVGVTDLKTSCGTGCKVMITGGTEGGHLSHGPGQPKLDIANDPVLDAYIKNPANQTMRITNMPGYGDVYTVKLKNGQIVQFLEEGVGATGSSGAHWHANFLGP